MNICIDPEPALPNFSASLWSEFPHLALAEFVLVLTVAYLQTSAPTGTKQEVMS
jgi:hypothetical protein